MLRDEGQTDIHIRILKAAYRKEKDGDDDYRPLSPTLDLDDRGSLPYDENAIIDTECWALT